MQRLKGHYEKQREEGKKMGKQPVVQLAVMGMHQEGRSYAAALEGRMAGVDIKIQRESVWAILGLEQKQ
jgi:hypothetical protein